VNASLDLETLHRKASGHYLRGEFDSAATIWRELLEHAPKDVRAREGVRLCEELARTAPVTATPTAPAEPVAQAAAAGDFVLDLNLADLAGPAGQELRDPVALDEAGEFDLPEGGDAAAAELERRVAQLLEQAESAAERGAAAEALAFLDRVLILDEEHATALAMRELLGGQSAPAFDGLPDAPPPPEIPEPGEADAQLATLDPPEESPEPPEVVAAPEAPGAPAPEPAPAPPVHSAPRRPSRQRVDRRTGLVLAVAGLGLAVGVWWLAGRGASDRPPPPAPPSSAAEPRRPAEAVAAPGPAAPAATPAAAGAPPSLGELMSQGDAAVRARDWAGAVLAYGRAIDLAPADLELRKKLQVAAAAYQAMEQERERWVQTRQAFDGGNYEEALRSLYRMPGNESDPRIVEYKARGWFNLGLTALRSRDCRSALTHLEEALSLRPQDRLIQHALALAHDCGQGGSTTFPVEVAGLTLRPLDD
jgi:tetratricopeptide (TPR) repeat protein